jgi:hypothetical protein
MLARPGLGLLEEGLGDCVVLHAIEKAEHALAMAAFARLESILGAADRAGWPAVSPGDEEVGVAIPEEQALLRIQDLPPLRQQRGDPQRVILVNAPGEGQEEAFFTPSPHRSNFDHGSSTFVPASELRRASSI